MPRNVTLRQLRAFSAVVETGSFTKAAKRLFVSQAALSGLIKELETQLHTKLLNRSTRRVDATSVGQVFYPLAKRVLDDLDDAVSNIDDLNELRRGVVRVAAPEVLSCTLLPELITTYEDLHPNINVKFDDIPIESLFQKLRSGEIDVGIAPFNHPDDEIIATTLMSSPFWVALPAGDPLAEKDSVQWKDIRHRCLFTFIRQFRERVLSNVPPRHHPTRIVEVGRINTALSMLRMRSGMTICPMFARPLIEGFGLAFKPLEKPVVFRETAAFVRREYSPPPAADRFLEHTSDYCERWLERLAAL